MAPRYHRGVIDGEVLPASVLSQVAAGSAREVDLIAGTTRDEMTLPIGDDVTDEDAFRVLQYSGIAVVVGQEERQTLAEYALRDPDEVRLFLSELATLLEGRSS